MKISARVMAATSIATFALAMVSTGASAQVDKNLVGTWTVVSVTYEQGGKKIEPYGPNVKGTQIYDANGRIATIVMRPDLPKVASNNRMTATAEESQKIVHGSIAYFGTYTTNEADHSVTVQIEGATLPNWMGTSQKRTYTISGDQLTISNPTGSGAGAATVVLKRAARFALTRRLARQGYLNVTTAADGRQALELLNSRPFDLVLLDIMMPRPSPISLALSGPSTGSDGLRQRL